MSATSAPTPPTYDVCTPARWDDWYKAIGVLGDGGTDFGLLETVGQELRTMKVPFAEGWGDTLNDLQMGRLRNKLRQANVRGSGSGVPVNDARAGSSNSSGLGSSETVDRYTWGSRCCG